MCYSPWPDEEAKRVLLRARLRELAGKPPLPSLREMIKAEMKQECPDCGGSGRVPIPFYASGLRRFDKCPKCSKEREE